MVKDRPPASMHPRERRESEAGRHIQAAKRHKILTYRAISEVEALRRVALDLGVEVYKESTDGMLVGLADATPKAVVPLYHLIPLCFRFLSALS